MSDEFRQRVLGATAEIVHARHGRFMDVRTLDAALDVLASEPWVRDRWASAAWDSTEWFDMDTGDVAEAVQATLARDA